jgi:hypothetical protein
MVPPFPVVNATAARYRIHAIWRL